MNPAEPDITKRAEQSPLFKDLSEQNGKTLPYLLERYLLLENWKYNERLDSNGFLGPDRSDPVSHDDVQFLHLLVAEACTVLLDYEGRIRRLEERCSKIL